MHEKEAAEIAYITNCIKGNRKIDSLIAWELSGTYVNYENSISYKYKRNQRAFFELHKDSKGEFLRSINYFYRNFQKVIFLDDTIGKHEITSETRFGVWMSKERPSTYFCLINPDNIKIWVLTQGDTVYIP